MNRPRGLRNCRPLRDTRYGGAARLQGHVSRPPRGTGSGGTCHRTLPGHTHRHLPSRDTRSWAYRRRSPPASRIPGTAPPDHHPDHVGVRSWRAGVGVESPRRPAWPRGWGWTSPPGRGSGGTAHLRPPVRTRRYPPIRDSHSEACRRRSRRASRAHAAAPPGPFL